MSYLSQYEHAGRIEAIDTLKGLLIVLVVFGHSIQCLLYGASADRMHFSDPIFQVIYMFHIPLFMALSGFVSFKRRILFSRQIVKRGKVLLGPTVSWTLFFMILTFLVTDDSIVYTISKIPSMFLMLWYLPCLFVSWIITVGVETLLGDFNEGIRKVALLVFFILLLLLPDSNLLPYLKYTFPFFVIGFYFAKEVTERGAWMRAKYYTATAALIAFALCFYLWQPNTYFYASGFPLTFEGMQLIVLRYVSALAGAILFISCSLILMPVINTKFIRFLGVNSLYVYIIQTFFFRGVVLFNVHMDSIGLISYGYLLAMSLFLSWLFVLMGMVGVRVPMLGQLFLGKSPTTDLILQRT